MNPFRTKRAEPAATTRRRSRGQVIVIFAGAMLAFMGLMAIVIDVSWYWANTLRVQRAADAAALAGVVWLPSHFSGTAPNAQTTALAEALKNGYAPGAGTTIAMSQDINNDRRLIVTVSTSVPSFFARVLGVASFPVSRTSQAEFILPVAMGSPENYYGVFGDIKDATFTGPQTTDTTFLPSTNNAASGKCGVSGTPICNWTNTGNVDSPEVVPNNTFTTSTTANGSQQAWGEWNFNLPSGATINGIEVRLQARLGGSGTTAANCTLGIQLSPNGGGNWYPGTTNGAVTPGLTTTSAQYTVGTAGSQAPWLVHSWVQGDFSSTAGSGFLARLTWNRGGCQSTRTAQVDTLTIRVTYTAMITSAPANKALKAPNTPCLNGATGCFNPDAAGTLNYRGFWATMNTEGAANVNGDAYQPYYDTNTSTVAPACPVSAPRACYDSYNYYNYGIYMPPGSTGGFVYLFDPEFCRTDLPSGVGDRWFDNNNPPVGNPISSFYELFDTKNTPYNLADDYPAITGTGAKFTNMNGFDTQMSRALNSGNPPALPAGTTECQQRSTTYGNTNDYHNSWYLMNAANPLTGGADGTLYRLHTMSTDPGNVSAQRNANGEQSFAIYVKSSDIANTQVYGLGAMQMFSPIEVHSASAASEFYLAQVPQAHAGKTLEISLWDPGDTGNLAANIQIEIPSTTVGVWTPSTMTWSSVAGTSNGGAKNCAAYGNGSGTSIVTNTGSGSGVFNGCWLTIDVTIPASYTGPQQGWWKIKYNMSGDDTSSDVTTWTAKIRGNPVHLVLP